jgi:hypothetical protein
VSDVSDVSDVSHDRSALIRWWRAPAAPYVAAVGVRTAARAAWGLALPTVLTVAAYGSYQVVATAAVMAAQLALLGAPQTIVRYAGHRLPMRLLVLQAVALAAVAIGVAVAFVPTARTPVVLAALASLTIATVGATLFGARAKARLAFRTSFGAELAGAAVLVAGAILAVSGAIRDVVTPGLALIVESVALIATAVFLLRARRAPAAAGGEPEARAPTVRRVFGDIYSVGALVLLDVVLFRRLEVYFLERSPDGLAGVAVLGLALQIVAIAMLIPTALLETWQPRFALARSTGGDAAFDLEIRRRGRQFAPLMVGVVVLGTAVPFAAVPLVFPQYRPWLGYIVGFVLIRLVSAGAGFYSSALYAAGRHRALYGPAVACATVAIGANAVFTRQLGLRGALVAYGATQLTVAALTVIAFYRSSTRVRPTASLAPSPLVAAGGPLSGPE